MKNHALLLLTFAVPAAATAQTSAPTQEDAPTLETVVVTGSRVEQPSFALPYSVDAVTVGRSGRAQPGVNLSEELAAIPGVIVQNRQNYAQDLQVSSRGFGARSAFGIRGVRVYADGIPASMPDGQGQAATLNLDLADRIEVLRGPFAVMYGNHSGGVVQMRTRDAGERPAVTFAADAGSWDSWKTGLTAEGRGGNQQYLLNASRFETGGYREHSAADREQAYAKMGFALAGKGRLSIIASGLRQDNAQDPLGLDWAGYQADRRGAAAAALAFNTRKSISHLQGGLVYEDRIGAGELQLAAYSGKRRVVQYQAIPVAAQASATSSGGVIDFDRRFDGLNGRWSMGGTLAGAEFVGTAGFELERMEDERLGYENFADGRLGVRGRLRRDEDDRAHSAGAYLQAELQGERWGVHGGVRHSRVGFRVEDDYLVNGDDSGRRTYRHTSPSLGVVYRFSDALVGYASAARGFETPTFNELFYARAGGFNFDLQPAISKHLELGLKARAGERTRLNVALFGVRTRDELVVDAAAGGRTSYRNASKTERTGIEIGAEHRWTRSLQSRLAFTAIDARFKDDGATDGKHLPGIPRRSLFADLGWQDRETGLGAGVELIAGGRAQVDDRNLERPAPGYGLVNLRFSAEQTLGAWHLKEYLRVNNLFDKDYIGSVIVNDGNRRYYEPGTGCNWMIGASAQYRF